MKKAPCKDCPDRQLRCHSTCEKYLAFDKERKKLNKLKHEDAVARCYDYKSSVAKRHKQNLKYWK